MKFGVIKPIIQVLSLLLTLNDLIQQIILITKRKETTYLIGLLRERSIYTYMEELCKLKCNTNHQLLTNADLCPNLSTSA